MIFRFSHDKMVKRE